MYCPPTFVNIDYLLCDTPVIPSWDFTGNVCLRSSSTESGNYVLSKTSADSFLVSVYSPFDSVRLTIGLGGSEARIV